MGIQGLLPFLKRASRPASIKEFKGCTVAIDSYCWLHKGAFSCAEKLAMGEKTDQYVYYCMKFVNNLLSFGIKPVMVFDGCRLPSKKDVEQARREKRQLNRKKAAQLLREGKKAEARDCITKSIDVTPQMALELMNTCREKGVDCIVAPYEADAQLAYLNKVGIAQVIITEDSDLVLFGCTMVMFKMDFAGNGILIENKDLHLAMELRSDVYSFDKFRYMCVLSGCDYLANLPGIGLGKAKKVFQKTRQSDVKIVLKKLPTILNMASLTVTSDYVEGFTKATNTFLYQLVFDPIKKDIIPLNAYPPEIDPEQLHYAGPPIPRKKAFHIALGNIDINTGETIADFNPITFKPKSTGWDESDGTAIQPHMLSIWDKNYKPMPKSFLVKPDPVKVERHSTKGKEMCVNLSAFQHRAPVKRPMEDDVLPESADDLAGMYLQEKNGPATKRQRTELHEINMDWDDLRSRNSPSPDNSNQSVFESDSRSNNPTCDSISPPVAGGSCDIDHNDGLDESQDRKENTVEEEISHIENKPRNRFAVSALKIHKDKFRLNASKGENTVEVRSRFFKDEKPLKRTEFFHELAKEHDDVVMVDSVSISPHKTDYQHVTNRARIEIKTESNIAVIKSENETVNQSANHTAKQSQIGNAGGRNTSQPRRTSSNKSPYGSFGSMSRFLSKHDKSTPKPLASPEVNREFKPVVRCLSKGEVQLKSEVDEFTNDNEQETDLDSLPSVNNGSQKAILDDLKTECLTTHLGHVSENSGERLSETKLPSPSVDEPSCESLLQSSSETLLCASRSRSTSQTSLFSAKNVLSDCDVSRQADEKSSEDVIDLTDYVGGSGDCVELCQSVNSKSLSSTPKQSPTALKSSSMSSCRRPGLSRKGSSTKLNKKMSSSQGANQPKITALLNQFSFQRRSSEKIEPIEKL